MTHNALLGASKTSLAFLLLLGALMFSGTSVTAQTQTGGGTPAPAPVAEKKIVKIDKFTFCTTNANGHVDSYTFTDSNGDSHFVVVGSPSAGSTADINRAKDQVADEDSNVCVSAILKCEEGQPTKHCGFLRQMT